MVATVKRDLTAAREAQDAVETYREQAAKDAEELEYLRERLRQCEEEVVACRSQRDELRDVRAENLELRASNARKIVAEQNFEHELAVLRMENHSLVETDLTAARHRAEEAELKVATLRAHEEDADRKVAEVNSQLGQMRKEKLALKKALTDATKQLKWRKFRKGKHVPGFPKPQLPKEARGRVAVS